MKTLAVVRASAWDADYEPYLNETLLYLDEETDRFDALLGALRLVEIDDSLTPSPVRRPSRRKTPASSSPYACPSTATLPARAADLTRTAPR